VGEAEFDIGVLFAALGEDLEPDVGAEHVQVVFGGFFAEEVDGGSSGNLRLRGHGELFSGGNGPLCAREGGAKESQGRE